MAVVAAEAEILEVGRSGDFEKFKDLAEAP